MNPREELRELIAQAKEHLRYYGELGLTHIGETSRLAAPQPKVEDHAAVESALTTSAATETKRPEPPAPTIISPPQFVPKPTITMPTELCESLALWRAVDLRRSRAIINRDSTLRRNHR
jgi:hypothetical protein